MQCQNSNSFVLLLYFILFFYLMCIYIVTVFLSIDNVHNKKMMIHLWKCSDTTSFWCDIPDFIKCYVNPNFEFTHL